jgi:hypothetical protein
MEPMMHSLDPEQSHDVASAVALSAPLQRANETAIMEHQISTVRRKLKMFDEDLNEREDETTHHIADEDEGDAAQYPPFGSERAFSDRSMSNTSISSFASNKSVRWSTIEVHSHDVVLGDHPCCSVEGPPLSIGWNSISTIEMSIDDYESERTPERRSDPVDLIVPAAVRRRRLLERGYSESQIRDRLSELTAIQKSRRKSSGGSRLKPWELIRKNLTALSGKPKIIEVRSFSE